MIIACVKKEQGSVSSRAAYAGEFNRFFVCGSLAGGGLIVFTKAGDKADVNEDFHGRGTPSNIHHKPSPTRVTVKVRSFLLSRDYDDHSFFGKRALYRAQNVISIKNKTKYKAQPDQHSHSPATRKNKSLI